MLLLRIMAHGTSLRHPTPGSSSQHAVILLIRESGGGVAGWLSSVDGVEGLRLALASWALESDALRV